MYQDRIEYLRREIKRTYKRYTGERTDGKATLLDVVKFFNIPVDESRTEDYSIKKIDYCTPSIEVIDTKNNTLFVAGYTCNADLFNSYGGEVKYVRLSSVNESRKLDSLSYIGEETPIITKMSFTSGDYELVFEKEMPNSAKLFITDGVEFAIRYFQNLVYEGRNVRQQLLAKRFKNNFEHEDDDSFEQIYTYGNNGNYIKKINPQDKYTYIRNNEVIYGIEELKQEDICHYFRGICFENSNVDVERYLPHFIESDDPIFSVNDTKSIIVFRGGTGNAIHHNFTISKIENQDNVEDKSGCDIYLNYEAIKWKNFEDENGVPQHEKIVVASKTSGYPKIENGNITSLEIRNIIQELDNEFKDDTFIQIVINELETFANKMDIQKGIIQEELESLSPKAFIDKSFDEICDLVSENQDEYFKLIAEQFYGLTNNSTSKEKGQVKVLKPEDLQSGNN